MVIFAGGGNIAVGFSGDKGVLIAVFVGALPEFFAGHHLTVSVDHFQSHIRPVGDKGQRLSLTGKDGKTIAILTISGADDHLNHRLATDGPSDDLHLVAFIQRCRIHLHGSDRVQHLVSIIADPSVKGNGGRLTHAPLVGDGDGGQGRDTNKMHGVVLGIGDPIRHRCTDSIDDRIALCAPLQHIGSAAGQRFKGDHRCLFFPGIGAGVDGGQGRQNRQTFVIKHIGVDRAVEAVKYADGGRAIFPCSHREFLVGELVLLIGFTSVAAGEPECIGFQQIGLGHRQDDAFRTVHREAALCPGIAVNCAEGIVTGRKLHPALVRSPDLSVGILDCDLHIRTNRTGIREGNAIVLTSQSVLIALDSGVQLLGQKQGRCAVQTHELRECSVIFRFGSGAYICGLCGVIRHRSHQRHQARAGLGV